MKKLGMPVHKVAHMWLNPSPGVTNPSDPRVTAERTTRLLAENGWTGAQIAEFFRRYGRGLRPSDNRVCGGGWGITGKGPFHTREDMFR